MTEVLCQKSHSDPPRHLTSFHVVCNHDRHLQVSLELFPFLGLSTLLFLQLLNLFLQAKSFLLQKSYISISIVKSHL